MNPDIPPAQGDNSNLNKLEKDLDDLTHKASLETNTIKDEPSPTAPQDVVAQGSPNAETLKNKNSIVFTVGIVLMVFAVILALVYLVGSQLFGTKALLQQQVVATPTISATAIPSEVPLVSPTLVATPSSTPLSASESATPSN